MDAYDWTGIEEPFQRPELMSLRIDFAWLEIRVMVTMKGRSG